MEKADESLLQDLANDYGDYLLIDTSSEVGTTTAYLTFIENYNQLKIFTKHEAMAINIGNHFFK